jgi:hypothetical protein
MDTALSTEGQSSSGFLSFPRVPIQALTSLGLLWPMAVSRTSLFLITSPGGLVGTLWNISAVCLGFGPAWPGAVGLETTTEAKPLLNSSCYC